MTEKMDLGGMAKAMHQKQVEARQDGGPGSGKKKGSGKGTDLSELRQALAGKTAKHGKEKKLQKSRKGIREALGGKTKSVRGVADF